MPRAILERTFEADRNLRAAERELLDKDQEALSALLTAAVEEAKQEKNEAETVMRLERLADLCAQVPGPAMADALISILDDEEPSVRVSAGEALLDVTYDYYAEVARAIDRALDARQTGPAMCELPFLLAEVGEPGAVKQLKRFLENPNADVVAAAVEASVQLMDAEMIEPLNALTNDTREVSLEFEEETKATVGELAEEAVTALSALSELEDDED